MKAEYYFETKEFTGGNTLVRQGQPVDGFHLIRSGEFEVSRRVPINDDEFDPRFAKNIIKKREFIDTRVHIYFTYLCLYSYVFYTKMTTLGYTPDSKMRAKRMCIDS